MLVYQRVTQKDTHEHLTLRILKSHPLLHQDVHLLAYPKGLVKIKSPLAIEIRIVCLGQMRGWLPGLFGGYQPLLGAPTPYSRWWFQIIFIFTPIPGEMIQFDGSHIFQMGGEKPPTSCVWDLFLITSTNLKSHFLVEVFVTLGGWGLDRKGLKV